MESDSSIFQRRRHGERGDGVLLGVGAIALLLLFAFFTVNATYYYSRKQALDTLARQVAVNAATSLPSPEKSYQSAHATFTALTRNLINGQARFLHPLSLQVFIEHYDPLAGAFVKTEFEAADNSQQFTLPVRSVSIAIHSSYSLTWFTPSTLPQAGLGIVPLTAHATAHLVPADIVLVFENSSSLITPVSSEGALPPLTPFANWADEIVGGMPAEYGAIQSGIGKDLAVTRSCYGAAALQMKRAAITLYDLLSASASFRVSILPSLIAQGETAMAVPEFSADGALAGNQQSVSPHPFHASGESGPPTSRCAALTQLSEFSVPEHPLASDRATLATSRTSLAALLECNGLPDEALCPGDIHLQFAGGSGSGLKLLPREFLWTLPAGALTAAGTLQEQTILQHPQMALLRASDLLTLAPKRSDNLPVNRRFIYFLTDGFELPVTDQAASPPFQDDRQLTRTVELSAQQGDNFTLQKMEWLPGSGSSPLEQGYFDHFCIAEPSGNPVANQIATTTSISDGTGLDPALNAEGIKLGILYFGFRSSLFDSLPESDPLQRHKVLPGHSLLDAQSFRSECNSKWTTSRGLFIVEASPDTPALEVGQFASQVAPNIARTAFSPELSY